MQVKVPKFIEIEDKIISVGGFGITWKQFLALLLGLGGGFIANRIFIPIIGIPLMVMSFIFGGAMAFGSAYGRPLTVYLSAVWRFFYKPHNYIWKQTPPRVHFDAPSTHSASSSGKPQNSIQTLAETEKKLSEIAKLLDK